MCCDVLQPKGVPIEAHDRWGQQPEGAALALHCTRKVPEYEVDYQLGVGLGDGGHDRHKRLSCSEGVQGNAAAGRDMPQGMNTTACLLDLVGRNHAVSFRSHVGV